MLIDFLEKLVGLKLTNLQGLLIFIITISLILLLVYINFVVFNDKLYEVKLKYVNTDNYQELFEKQRKHLIKKIIFIDSFLLLTSSFLIILIVNYLKYEVLFLTDMLIITSISFIILTIIIFLISFIILYLNWLKFKNKKITHMEYLRNNDKNIKMTQKICYILIIASLVIGGLTRIIYK